MTDRPDAAASRSLIRVVLADDHAVVREGLKAVVNTQSDMCVVGEVSDGEAACEAACALTPDILIMDLSMPLVGGAEATARIRRDCPRVKVLALTVHEEPVYIAELLRAGAAGYILKRAVPSELVRAVRAVAAGDAYLDPSVTGALVRSYVEGQPVAEQPRHGVLSDRERDVVVRVARGYSNKEIAAALGVSVKTVETYKARVGAKLGLRSRVAIVRYASRMGWLDDV